MTFLFTFERKLGLFDPNLGDSDPNNKTFNVFCSDKNQLPRDEHLFVAAVVGSGNFDGFFSTIVSFLLRTQRRSYGTRNGFVVWFFFDFQTTDPVARYDRQSKRRKKTERKTNDRHNNE